MQPKVHGPRDMLALAQARENFKKKTPHFSLKYDKIVGFA
jgi:hypothetical protein